MRLKFQPSGCAGRPTASAPLPPRTGRRCSDGFQRLIQLGHWNLSLEALVLQPQWGSLFRDEEANEALSRLLEAGCRLW